MIKKGMENSFISQVVDLVVEERYTVLNNHVQLINPVHNVPSNYIQEFI